MRFRFAVHFVFLFASIAVLSTSPTNAQSPPADQVWSSYSTGPSLPPPPGRTIRPSDSQHGPEQTGPVPTTRPRVGPPTRPQASQFGTLDRAPSEQRVATASVNNRLPPLTRPASPFASTEPPVSQRPAQRSGELLESAKVIATVGDQVILAGDLLGQVNQFLQQYVGRVSPEQLEQRRWELVKQLLPGAIDSKLVYVDFLRSVPSDRVPEVLDNIYRQFDDSYLPKMIEKAKVQTAADLDRMLRSFGSSLDAQRRTFAEQMLAAQWKRRSASSSKPVSHDDMLQYYQAHLQDYEIQARARWEHLMTRKLEFATSQAAEVELARMGNEVRYGASLEAVAKRKSQGPTAAAGGQYDWTTRGSLVSTVLDETIFSIPINKLSRILEDDEGFHIVRVIERQDAGTVPFEEAQAKIKEKISEQREEQELQSYLEGLREKTHVWTVFDEELASHP